MKEKAVWRAAAALFGPWWAWAACALGAAWAISLCVRILLGGLSQGDASLWFGHLFSSVIVVSCAVGFVLLPKTFKSITTLRLAPNATQLQHAFRIRLATIFIVMLPVAALLGASRLIAPAATAGVLSPISVLSMGDWAYALWILLLYTGFAMVVAELNRSGVPILALVVGAIPLISHKPTDDDWKFLVGMSILLCFALWYRSKRTSARVARSTDRASYEARSNAIEIESGSSSDAHAKFMRQLQRAKNTTGIRVSSLLSLAHGSTALIASSVLSVGLGFGIVAASAGLSGGIGHVGIFFIATVVMHVAATPLLPMALLPIGFRREKIATELWVSWCKRDVALWLGATVFAAIWLLAAHFVGLWLPFSESRKLASMKTDWLLALPSSAAFAIGIVGIGIAASSRFFFSATPSLMCSPRIWSVSRCAAVFIIAGMVISAELLLHRFVDLSALNGSFTLRMIVAACIVLPLNTFVYHLAARGGWLRANLVQISTTLRAHENQAFLETQSDLSPARR